MMEATLASFWSELFETQVRYTGLSFIYQFSGISASGLTPLIAASLLSAGDNQPWLLGGYMIAASLLAVVCTYALRETYKTDIYATTASKKPPEPQPAAKG